MYKVHKQECLWIALVQIFLNEVCHHITCSMHNLINYVKKWNLIRTPPLSKEQNLEKYSLWMNSSKSRASLWKCHDFLQSIIILYRLVALCRIDLQREVLWNSLIFQWEFPWSFLAFQMEVLLIRSSLRFLDFSTKSSRKSWTFQHEVLWSSLLVVFV